MEQAKEPRTSSPETSQTSIEQNGVQESHTATPPTSPKSHKKLYIILAILALLLLCGGAYWAISSQRTASDEELAYEILEDNDNPQDYRDYLEKFPNGQHVEEVRGRLEKLEKMLEQWNAIALSDNVNDFKNFKNSYDDARYRRLCDIKIDSLDFVRAQREGTEEAFQRYLEAHPDGQYAAEASVAQGSIRDQEVSSDDREQIMRVLSDFFKGFEEQDETLICSNITATMKAFLHQKNATKAAVVKTIRGMYNEHIQSCKFTVNRDIEITRETGTGTDGGAYHATFTIDQHIERDNEGKTFGSYKCEAEITPRLLISSLTMEELSQQ